MSQTKKKSVKLNVNKYKSEKRKGDKKNLIIQKRTRNKHIYLQIKRDTKKKVQKLTKKRTEHKTHEKHI